MTDAASPEASSLTPGGGNPGTVRVAVLSFWHVHAKDYAQEADENPAVEVVAVWDEDAERGRAEAERRGVRWYDDLDSLLAEPDIDGVIVTTATTVHRDIMLAAARAGKHIFTEKVLAPSVRECDEIVAAVEHSGVVLMVSLRELDKGFTGAIKALVDDGRLGDVTLVRVRFAHNGAVATPQHPQGWLPARFYATAESGGGAMIDLGCHPMYLARYFGGLPDSVSASYGYYSGREAEDNAVTILGYDNGALGVVETSFVSGFSPFTIEVYGTKGTLLFGVQPGQLLARGAAFGADPREWVQQELPADKPRAFDQWVTHIQQGSTAPDNVRYAVDLTRLMEASNRSALERRTVRLTE